MDLGAVMQIAADQHGVVARWQLRALGCSPNSISRARARRELVPATASTYRLPVSPDDFWARCKAVELEVGRRGLLIGVTAARLHGIRRMPSDPIQVMIPNGRRVTPEPWMDVHFSSWFDYRRDATTLDRITVASPMRTLFSLAATLDDIRFRRAAEDAWHLGLITPHEAREYLEANRCRGKDGVRRLERWLDGASQQGRPSQSDLERRMLEALEQIGLPQPVRQYPLDLTPVDRIYLDIAWPEIRLAIEPGHSWWHGGDAGQRRDQSRDRACNEIGWMIVRFDETMARDPLDAARQVQKIHERRRHDLRSS